MISESKLTGFIYIGYFSEKSYLVIYWRPQLETKLLYLEFTVNYIDFKTRLFLRKQHLLCYMYFLWQIVDISFRRYEYRFSGGCVNKLQANEEYIKQFLTIIVE